MADKACVFRQLHMGTWAMTAKMSSVRPLTLRKRFNLPYLFFQKRKELLFLLSLT